MTSPEPAPASSALLSARSLTASLPGDVGPVKVLQSVSLDVAEGELIDVVGPSGSGKSTLLRALARLLPQMGGELSLQGRDAKQFTPQQWRGQVALLPQKPAIVPGSVRDNLLLPWTLKTRSHDKPPTDDALVSALADVALADIDLDRDAARLSVGQQARVALLRVLLTNPRPAARRAGRSARRRVRGSSPARAQRCSLRLAAPSCACAIGATTCSPVGACG